MVAKTVYGCPDDGGNADSNDHVEPCGKKNIFQSPSNNKTAFNGSDVNYDYGGDYDDNSGNAGAT